jgi:hypothetical protein
LLFATTSGSPNTAAFVSRTPMRSSQDLAQATALRERAKLCVRARNYGLRGLGRAIAGSPTPSRRTRAPRSVMRTADMPQLVDGDGVGRVDLAIEDDPSAWPSAPDGGDGRSRAGARRAGTRALHVLITYEMARTGVKGDAAERSRGSSSGRGQSRGWRAPLVATRNRSACEAGFQAVRVADRTGTGDQQHAISASRAIHQRRARWLLSKKDELFLILDGPEAKSMAPMNRLPSSPILPRGVSSERHPSRSKSAALCRGVAAPASATPARCGPCSWLGSSTVAGSSVQAAVVEIKLNTRADRQQLLQEPQVSRGLEEGLEQLSGPDVYGDGKLGGETDTVGLMGVNSSDAMLGGGSQRDRVGAEGCPSR